MASTAIIDRTVAHSPYPMVETMVGPIAVLDNGLLLIENWHRTAADAAARKLVDGATVGTLPELASNGYLPPGVHRASLTELADTFATTPHRAHQFKAFAAEIPRLQGAGIDDALVGGSYVSAKAAPGDIDVALIPNKDAKYSVEFLTVHKASEQGLSLHDGRMIVRDAIELKRTPGEPYVHFLQYNGRVQEPVGTVVTALDPAEATEVIAKLDHRFGTATALIKPTSSPSGGWLRRAATAVFR